MSARGEETLGQAPPTVPMRSVPMRSAPMQQRARLSLLWSEVNDYRQALGRVLVYADELAALVEAGLQGEAEPRRPAEARAAWDAARASLERAAPHRLPELDDLRVNPIVRPLTEVDELACLEDEVRRLAADLAAEGEQVTERHEDLALKEAWPEGGHLDQGALERSRGGVEPGWTREMLASAGEHRAQRVESERKGAEARRLLVARKALVVRLLVARKALVVDGHEHDCSRWKNRWDELVHLARARAKAPSGGGRPLSKNARGNLVKALNSLSEGDGLGDMLIEHIGVPGTYRLAVVPEIEG